MPACQLIIYLLFSPSVRANTTTICLEDYSHWKLATLLDREKEANPSYNTLVPLSPRQQTKYDIVLFNKKIADSNHVQGSYAIEGHHGR